MPPGLEAYAAALRDHREDIVQAWERAVRNSPAGPRLDGPALRDHVAEILDRVASVLEPSETSQDGSAREHGRTRAAQGVGIVPVLEELGILRDVVLDVWSAAVGLDREAVRALDRVVDTSSMEAARRITETHDAFFRGVDAIHRASLESRSTDELLERLLQGIVRTAGSADGAAILLREGDALVLRAAVGLEDEGRRPGTLRVGQGLAGRVAAEVRPLHLEDAGAEPGAWADDVLAAQGARALYAVPLVAEGALVGVAEMGTLRSGGFSPEERRLFESMASRAALAVTRQLARDEDRHHRDELALLARLSRELVERLDVDLRLRRALDIVVPAFADWCAIFLPDGAESPRVTVRAAGPGEEALSREALERRPVDREAGRGIGRVLRDGRPELVPDLDDHSVGGEELAVLRRVGLRSSLAIPLAAPSGVVGAAWFGRAARRPPFDDRAVELATEIGSRVAIALDNAMLFERARREASLREHVLAVVSHDLRNPLSTVVLSASRIEARAPAGAPGDELRRVTAGIRRSARRMERLIADLLDVAAIQAGRLSVSRLPQPPGELVREAVEAMAPLAQERGLVLEAPAAPDLPPVLADRDRILQVLGNIVGNAIDVTGPGGRVEVKAAADGGVVRFAVADTGPGLAPEEAAHVFEPYRRGTDRYKGTGLGLAIAQGIVAAHGGRIGVDAAAGRGATFWFTLPVASSPQVARAP